jgi:hypothetical protein
MEQVTPQMLFGALVVLVIVALSLIVFLVRSFRKKRSQDQAPDELESLAMVQGAGLEAGETEGAMLFEAEEPAPPVPLVEIQEDAPPASSAVGLTPSAAGLTQSAAPPPDSEPVAAGDTLLMRVWEDSDGNLVVEVDGQRYERLFDIRSGAVGRHVLETIRRLVAFSKGKALRVAPEPPEPDVDDGIPPVARTAEEAIDEESQEVIEQWKQEDDDQPKPSRITIDPVPFRRQNEAQERGLTLNLAEEIDQLLQIRIKAYPQFSRRRIRVANAIDGGLRFEVDGITHHTLEEIPDDQVQALVRAAIRDWEVRR